MVRFCCVYGCSNRSGRDKDVRFFNVPSVISHQGEKTIELSVRRRNLWLANINRDAVDVCKPCDYAKPLLRRQRISSFKTQASFRKSFSVLHHITVYLELRDSDHVEFLSRRVEQFEKNVASEVSPQN